MSKLAEYMAEDGIYAGEGTDEILLKPDGRIQWDLEIERRGGSHTFSYTWEGPGPTVLLEAFASIVRDMRSWDREACLNGSMSFATFLTEIRGFSRYGTLSVESLMEFEDELSSYRDSYQDFLCLFLDMGEPASVAGELTIPDRAARYLDLTLDDLDEAESEAFALKGEMRQALKEEIQQ